MRRSAVAAACAAVALASTGGATAADVGANDDTGKYAEDGGAAFFDRMVAVGMKRIVMTVRFLPLDPGTIQDRALLERSIEQATRRGVRVALAVYPFPPSQLGLSSPAAFAEYAGEVAQAFPAVKQFIVLNEPNQPAFLRPQFDGRGQNVSATVAGRYLAATYDALKAVDPGITVVGIGLSPRGNDRPTASSNISTSPMRFLAALGRWYRASGRQLPIMDGFSFHPYPNRSTDPLDRGYPWPNAGFPNLDRIKQALWDAFNGTPQPTTLNGLRLYLDEVGWQVDTADLPGYTGEENVPVTDERTQARIYGRVIRRAACDPDIEEISFFGFYDDPARATGFQAALHHVDGTPRASAGSVQAAIADTAGGCFLPPAPKWRPVRTVLGAVRPVVTRLPRTIKIEVDAIEGADVVACTLAGRPARTVALRQLQQRLIRSSTACASGKARPRRPAVLRLAHTSSQPESVAIRVAAEANPKRTSAFVIRR